MKAVRIENKAPQLVELPKPSGSAVRVKVATASICGSDLHMIERGWAEQRVLGHEFAGTTYDGTAVAVEPVKGCNTCHYCDIGYPSQCSNGFQLLGVTLDGGMAEYVEVPEQSLVALPTGLDLQTACLVEPLAVALHGLNRVGVQTSDRVLVIGAGPVGLMTAAALQARGIACDLSARHPHQQRAAESLGASLDIGEGYDVVFDAVGSGASLKQACQLARPLGHIGMVGSFWEPVDFAMEFTVKELRISAAMMYQCKHDAREFVEAGNILARSPHIAPALVSHRFPLEGAVEAFATANDRAAGAIKVVFDI